MKTESARQGEECRPLLGGRTRYDSGSETSQNPPLSSYEAYRKGQIGFFFFIFGNLGNPGNLGNLGNPGNLGNLGNPFFEVEMFLFSTLDDVLVILVSLVISFGN